MFPAFAALLVASCAADPITPKDQPEQNASDDVVCTREYPTGSSIPMTKCRPSDQIARERRLGQEFLRRNTTGTAATKPGGS